MSSLEASSPGTEDLRDVFLRLKIPETRRDAVNRLRTFLSDSTLSAPLTSQDVHNAVHNAVSYVVSHPQTFTDKEAFLLIDLALANASIPDKEKEKFLSLSRLTRTCRVLFGLHLGQNLKDSTTHQGTYLRLLDLLRTSRALKEFNSDIFNAMRSIASQTTVFTNEQYCEIAECALDNESFSLTQKNYIFSWKPDSSGKRKSDGHPENNGPTYSSKLAISGPRGPRHHLISNQGSMIPSSRSQGSLQGAHALDISESRGLEPKLKEQARDASGTSKSPLFLQLSDPATCQEAYKVVLELVTKGKPIPNYKSQMFNAINVIACRPQLFTKTQFSTVANRAIMSRMFTDRQKKLFSEMLNRRIKKKRLDGCIISRSSEPPANFNTVQGNIVHMGVSNSLPFHDVKLGSGRNASSQLNACRLHINAEVTVQGRDSDTGELITNTGQDAEISSMDDSDREGFWWKALLGLCSACGGLREQFTR